MRPFDGEDEAVRLANSSPLGLAAYVYTRDLVPAMRLGRRLRAGMIACQPRPRVSTPPRSSGGSGTPAWGGPAGLEGIEEYLDTRYLALPA